MGAIVVRTEPPPPPIQADPVNVTPKSSFLGLVAQESKQWCNKGVITEWGDEMEKKMC